MQLPLLFSTSRGEGEDLAADIFFAGDGSSLTTTATDESSPRFPSGRIWPLPNNRRLPAAYF